MTPFDIAAIEGDKILKITVNSERHLTIHGEKFTFQLTNMIDQTDSDQIPVFNVRTTENRSGPRPRVKAPEKSATIFEFKRKNE